MAVNRRLVGLVAGVATCLVLPATAIALTLRSDARHHRGRSVLESVSTTGVSEVGALYTRSSPSFHDCSASVIDSAAGDVLMTAAHCVSGNAAGMTFVPDARPGRDAEPYGRWTITGIHVTPRWATLQDPREDVAFLTVAPRQIRGRTTEIQQVTGGYRLGSTAHSGDRVRVTGYDAGSDDSAITCAASVYTRSGFPAFDCGGYANGTSGSPWVMSTRSGNEVVGVIGGFHQGGCVESTSYSPLLTPDTMAAYSSASSGTATDVAPVPGGNGC